MACGDFHVFAGDETRIIRCQPLYGRSVKIVGKTKQDSLSLCEVQVFNDSVKVTEGVTYDVWFNKTNRGYEFLNSDVDSSGILQTFQAPKNIYDHYGVKMKTYFNAPETGYHIFNMSGDNKCVLYIRNVSDPNYDVVGRIPRDDSVPSWTRYESWDQAYYKPYHLTKGTVYELTALMAETDKKDHLRVGVTFPNGTFVGPINSRIFINEQAARSLTKNSCSRSDGTIMLSTSTSTSTSTPTSTSRSFPTKPTDRQHIETGISTAIDLFRNGKYKKSKFQLLTELERLGFEIGKNMSLNKRPFASYVVRVKSFVFAAVSMNLDTHDGFNFPGSLENFSLPDYDSISFPERAFPPGIGRRTAVFMMFKPLQEMLEQTGHKENHLLNNIVSASMEDEIWKDMNKPFTLVFRNTKVPINGQSHCVFWIEDSQYKKDGKFGRWSDDGCSLVDKNETHTTCQCKHLTKFTVLFPVQEGSEEDEMKLELITYVGLSLSSVGCLITFVVYLILRITKTLKTIVHLNLVLALGLADLVFLFGNFAENHRDICFASTVLAFYLYLAVFAWMLVEGIHLYFLVIRVFGRDEHRRRKYYHIIGWGAPAVVVLITAGILRYDLMSEKHCWLSTKSASIWVFIGPALFVILVNTLILAAVLRTTMTLLRNDPGHRKEKSAMRTLAMLVPILGTTWIFGIVAFAHDSIIFQYIFAVCNAFQGFFIFILYCLFNTEVRHEYQRKRKAWKTERELDSKRSPQNNSFDL
ncbi:adhesion G- coupled receptor D1-like [Paramuricea clavata]|uniref:Adhesion G- coupled receptor D1-like n=1 Tax=Paramuricea clavata TaxID=317549 RepID=A0A6S7GTA1_PARCT|nr:adhesion G- coupled receptor D1-like [Paramuricea clavata]